MAFSAPEAAAEIAIAAWRRSFFKNHPVRIASTRAGNVIGGGDWAQARIVVDCMRAWSRNQPVEIRSPRATRPWQHVLEPLSGYLSLGRALAASGALHGEAFNFGPRSEQSHTVLELLSDLGRRFGVEKGQVYRVTDNIPFHESELLKLNCDKALFHLGWRATWGYEDTIRQVSDWYYEYYRGSRQRLDALTVEQIDAYEAAARERGVAWASA